MPKETNNPAPNNPMPESGTPNSGVTTKQVPPMWVAQVRLVLPVNADAGRLLGEANARLRAYMAKHGLQAAGPHTTIWHQGPEVLVGEVVDAAYPLAPQDPSASAPSAPAEGDASVALLPGGLAASYTHHGAFSDFTRGHAAISAWMSEHGYPAPTGYREIYIRHEHAHMDDTITEIQVLLG